MTVDQQRKLKLKQVVSKHDINRVVQHEKLVTHNYNCAFGNCGLCSIQNLKPCVSEDCKIEKDFTKSVSLKQYIPQKKATCPRGELVETNNLILQNTEINQVELFKKFHKFVPKYVKQRWILR